MTILKLSIKRLKMLLFIILIAFSNVLFAEIIEIPNVGLSIDAPEGFSNSTTFDGLINLESNDAILMRILPESAPPEFVDSFTKELLLTRNINELSREKIILDDTEAILIKATQHANGEVFGKWLLLFYRNSQAFIVAATFRNLESDISDKIKLSLSSIGFI